MIADLDTLLIALYVELTDRIIPAQEHPRTRMGRPPLVTDAELVCQAVAQFLLRYDDERHWLRAAPQRVGHLFPRLLSQSEDNQRLKDAASLMEAALRWLAEHTPGSAELLRLMDGTPVPCGQSSRGPCWPARPPRRRPAGTRHPLSGLQQGSPDYVHVVPAPGQGLGGQQDVRAAVAALGPVRAQPHAGPVQPAHRPFPGLRPGP